MDHHFILTFSTCRKQSETKKRATVLLVVSCVYILHKAVQNTCDGCFCCDYQYDAFSARRRDSLRPLYSYTHVCTLKFSSKTCIKGTLRKTIGHCFIWAPPQTYTKSCRSPVRVLHLHVFLEQTVSVVASNLKRCNKIIVILSRIP